MSKYLLYASMFLAAAISASAQTGTGFKSFQMGADARAVAMGEAAAALAGGAATVFWNPALSAWQSRRQVHFTHNQWIQDISHDAAAVVWPKQSFTIGIHAMLASVSDIEQRDTASEEPLGTFSAHDLSTGINIAKAIGKNLAVGANLRYVYEKIYIETASGYAIDLGACYRPGDSGIQFAAVVQNLGATSNLYAESIDLGRTVRLGMSYQPSFAQLSDRLLFTADYVSIADYANYLHAGVEARPVPMLALRVGYQNGHSNRDVSAGFGLMLGHISLDYAFVPFKEDLGQSHRFSFAVDF